MDNKQNFTGRAENYTKGRPAYSNQLVDLLYDKYGFSLDKTIADIGSGTGKFAKQLLEKGSTVICVEPDDDMRQVGQKELSQYSKCQFVSGDASDTKVNSCSVDFVTAAQAFHWFDVSKFSDEYKRILKQNGKVVLIWNVRDINDKLNVESQDVYKKYCLRFKGFGGGIKEDDERISKFFNGNYEFVEFANPLVFDKEKFIQRSLSSSYSLKNGDPNYDEYIHELEKLFDKYAENGMLEMKNKTVAYIGSF